MGKMSSNSLNNKVLIVEEHIVGGAKDKALLLGLLNPKLDGEFYAQELYGEHRFAVEKRELPNRHSRLDILYINNYPVGTIVSSELTEGIYHMVGMLVAEPYRSRAIDKTLPGYADARAKKLGGGLSPAAFFLQVYLKDIVNTQGMQVSLEVLNGNQYAWKLYEKRLLANSDGLDAVGFELLPKKELEAYARLRGKKIGKWHSVETYENKKGYAVQWSHIPDYGTSTEKWSVNRVYMIKPRGQNFFFSEERIPQFKNKLRIILTIMFYGNPVGYIMNRIRVKWKNKKKRN